MATRTEIKPIKGHQRGVAVVQHDDGGFALEMRWPVDELEKANSSDPEHGYVQVSVAYLTMDERRALADTLLRPDN